MLSIFIKIIDQIPVLIGSYDEYSNPIDTHSIPLLHFLLCWGGVRRKADDGSGGGDGCCSEGHLL